MDSPGFTNSASTAANFFFCTPRTFLVGWLSRRRRFFFSYTQIQRVITRPHHTHPPTHHTHTYSLLAVFDGLSLLLDPEIIEIVSVCVELDAIFSIISIWSELRESWWLITRAAHTTHLSHTPHKLVCVPTCTLV